MFRFQKERTASEMVGSTLIFFVFSTIFIRDSSALLFDGQVCCDGIGCFDNLPPFGDILPLPDCPEKLSISMTLFTVNNPTSGKPISRSTIPGVYKGNRLLTVFIVHGWMNGKDSPWLSSMKDAFLKTGNFNVIIVGWEAGSKNNRFYNQAAANTRTVGSEVGLVARKLKQNSGLDISRLYCVGHGLGSHVCGHAGKFEKFGRITGLDPAGPLFEWRDWTAGLNPSCANFVDVIHTNGKPGSLPNLGTMNVLGHVDFYPNGGGRQPGCVGDFGIPDWTTFDFNNLIPSCSHGRAVSYFQESILTPCFLAISYTSCTDQQQLLSSCVSGKLSVQSMGFNATSFSARGTFYLTTSSASPYCNH